jgi:hypothetical protein
MVPDQPAFVLHMQPTGNATEAPGMKRARAISTAAVIGLLACAALGFAGRKPISQTLTRNRKVR